MFHFKSKSRPPSLTGPGHLRPRRRFLSNRKASIFSFMNFFCSNSVKMQWLLDSHFRHKHWQPIRLFLAVIEIQHRSTCVHPKSVNVETLQPEQRIGSEEIDYFRSAIIVNQRAPVRMFARRLSKCSYKQVPSKRASPCSSFGKCAGTQSKITPIPCWCRKSTKYIKSSGVP